MVGVCNNGIVSPSDIIDSASLTPTAAEVVLPLYSSPEVLLIIDLAESSCLSLKLDVSMILCAIYMSY